MNLTGNHNGLANPIPAAPSVGARWLPSIALVGYPLLKYALVPRISVILSIPVTAILYLLSIYLFYVIARLALQKRTYLIWVTAFLGYIIGYFGGGLNGVWGMLMDWSMLLFGGMIIGRLALKDVNSFRIYVIGASVVALFFLGYYLPQAELFAKSLDTMFAEMTKTYQSFGGTSAEKADLMAGMEKMMELGRRLQPSLLMLDAIVRFSIGFILFAIMQLRANPSKPFIKPFTEWRMPFVFTFILIGAVMLRLINNPLTVQLADNILLILFLYYSVCGLSLIEFYIVKFKISLFMKILFYLMFFLTQIFGLIAAVLLGFIDSFADFRKKQLLSFENE